MQIKQELEAYSKTNIYDFDNSIILNDYPNRVIEKLKSEGKDLLNLSLLELGLGHGYSTNVLKKHFRKYTVLEGDSRIIEIYKTQYSNTCVDIIHTCFEEFDTDKKYDVIIMGFILEHVDNPVEIIKKYKNMLNANGRIFITVPNAQALNRRIGKEIGMLKDLKQLSQNDIMLGHKRYYDVVTLKDDILKSESIVKSIEGIYLKPFTTAQLMSLDLSPEIYKALCTIGREYPELCLGLLAEVGK